MGGISLRGGRCHDQSQEDDNAEVVDQIEAGVGDQRSAPRAGSKQRSQIQHVVFPELQETVASHELQVGIQVSERRGQHIGCSGPHPRRGGRGEVQLTRTLSESVLDFILVFYFELSNANSNWGLFNIIS